MKLGDNASLPFLRAVSSRPTAPEHLTAYGYGEATPAMRSFTMRVAEGGRTLRENLPSHAADAISKAGSPSLDIEVVPIEDAIAPGLSGAPMLDTAGRIRAIADGGVGHGITRVAWAIPADYLSELATSPEAAAHYVAPNAHLSAVEESRAAVYIADYVAPDAPTVTCGSAELTKVRTVQLWDAVSAADAPADAVAFINLLKETSLILRKGTSLFPAGSYRVDVWEDRKSGAVAAVPTGMELTREGSFCVASGGGASIMIQVKQVPASTDPNVVAAQFERMVMSKYSLRDRLEWTPIGDPREFLRPDGLVLKHKAFEGKKFSYNQFERPTATLVDALATRNGTFLGVAAVWRGRTDDRTRIWVPVATSVYVATFGISASQKRGLVEWQTR
jgi:hypothetical protein